MTVASEEQDKVPTQPQAEPPRIGIGHPEYHFVQAVMELQKTMAETKAAVNVMAADVRSVKTKVEDLVNWKNRIIGGAVVIGFILTIIFGASKLLSGISITFAGQDQLQELVKK